MSHRHTDGGIEKDVLLVETDDINDEIDAVYRTEYHRYADSIVESIVSQKSARRDALAGGGVQ